MEAGGERVGWLGALAPPNRTTIGRADTRLLSAVADQIAQAVRQDRLASEAREAEIARQSDELKSALLQSVSHDLRTPLATIRAAAGSLRPGLALSDAERNETVDAIDREVEYLNRLVTNLLDLSRIESGVLRADRDPYHLDDALSGTLERARARLRPRSITVDLGPAVVLVDPILLDEAVTNVLDNVAKYTPPEAAVRVSAQPLPDSTHVRMTIEDGGPGVPDEQLPRIFEKFYRVPGQIRVSRSGTGVGLAVVRGVVEAMGGRVSARRSALGGLAVDIDLPAGAERHTEVTAA
jgi:two-component system sensor histidine kinase KdpD